MSTVTNLIEAFDRWLFDHNWAKKKLEVEIDPTKPGPIVVEDILRAACEKKIGSPVARHLVGAKLALRYPDKNIENHGCTTADVQLGRPGDFVVGDTVFHVTVAPMPAVIDKCDSNIRNRYRAVLLVPGSKLQAARQFAELKNLQNRIGVSSIEQFVGLNIEELSGFDNASFSSNIKALLNKYNERVDAIETDKFLLIKVPGNL